MYAPIIKAIFASKYRKGMCEVDFEREDIIKFGKKMEMALPKNTDDLVYRFRYRSDLPESIKKHAPKSQIRIIRPRGRAKYRFALVSDQPLVPSEVLATTKVPDAAPGIVTKYAFNDEQALLAILRYNRLVDIFTGVTCYSLQNHLRTTVPEMGQVETDEIYVGVDKRGVQYVFPLQAKGGTDRLNVVQIEQDFGVCATKFPALVCRPIGAQFMSDNVIALFEFEDGGDGVRVSAEKHYKLVSPDDVTDADLESYRQRTGE